MTNNQTVHPHITPPKYSDVEHGIPRPTNLSEHEFKNSNFNKIMHTPELIDLFENSYDLKHEIGYYEKFYSKIISGRFTDIVIDLESFQAFVPSNSYPNGFGQYGFQTNSRNNFNPFQQNFSPQQFPGEHQQQKILNTDNPYVKNLQKFINIIPMVESYKDLEFIDGILDLLLTYKQLSKLVYPDFWLKITRDFSIFENLKHKNLLDIKKKITRNPVIRSVKEAEIDRDTICKILSKNNYRCDRFNYSNIIGINITLHTEVFQNPSSVQSELHSIRDLIKDENFEPTVLLQTYYDVDDDMLSMHAIMFYIASI
jgi:hypothetical protein